MATNPYLTKMPQYAFNALTFYHRNGAYPLDDTSVWESKDQFVTYLNEAGTYAYAGQLVTIANGSIEDTNGDKDYSIAIVRSDGSYQIVGDSSFESTAVAEAWVTKNPEVATAGKTLTVKAADGNKFELYVINADKTLTRVSFEASDIPELTWSALTGKPTSAVADIDAAVTFSKKFVASDDSLTYNGSEVAMVSDIPTTYDAAKITGIINIDNLPATAVERLSVVENEAAMLALTVSDVQVGDTVKTADNGKMFYVKDSSKLGTLEAFEEYTVGSAASVPWSGVTGKPTTLDGYGITDAVYASEKSSTPVAGKVVVYTDDAKLNGTATNAEQLGGQGPSYYATAEALNAEVSARESAITTVTNSVNALTGRMDTAESKISSLETDNAANKTAIGKLQSGESITAIDASKLTGIVDRENLPADVGGKVVTVASEDELASLTADNVNLGDLVQVSGGALYMYTSAADLGSTNAFTKLVDVTGSQIAWSQITGTPTTLAGYGITDAVNSSEVSAEVAANKIVKRDADGKIAGTVANAETLGGNAPAYYATASSVTALTGRMDTAETDIANLKSGDAITSIAANKIDGIIDISNLPATVIERLYVAADDNARLALTISDVQDGDTVKVASTGKMYFVKDSSKLGTEAAFEEYTVGVAGAVEWSGVLNKPTTLSGYGITDNVVVYNEDGTSINAKVAFTNITGLDAVVTADALKDAVEKKHSHANLAVLDKLTENAEGALMHNSKEVAYVADVATLAKIPVLDAPPANAFEGQIYFQTL